MSSGDVVGVVRESGEMIGCGSGTFGVACACIQKLRVDGGTGVP